VNDQEEYTQFVPFNAINEFMLDDFRFEVIKLTLNKLPDLPVENQKGINILTRKLIKVSGFRNSTRAPIGLRAKASVDAFQKNPKFVAAILSGWAEVQADLRELVFRMLEDRDWDLLPADADRTKLPGFMPAWPKGEDFDSLIAAFHQSNPEVLTENDDISLMVVWMSMRLPYQGNDGDQDDDLS
jgi:hypothetical protein